MIKKDYSKRILVAIDKINSAASAYEMTQNQFLTQAGIGQSSLSQIKSKLNSGKSSQGFTMEFFFRLKDTYPDLNLSYFFDDDQPIRGRRLYKLTEEGSKNIAAESEVHYNRMDALFEAKEKEIALLRDKVKLLEELLENYRGRK